MVNPEDKYEKIFPPPSTNLHPATSFMTGRRSENLNNYLLYNLTLENEKKTFVDFWIQLITNVESFAEEKWNEIKEAAVEDSKDFLTSVKDDVQRWISLLAEGKLTFDDLLWLIKRKRDLAQLFFLKQKGFAQPDLDKFFEGLLETIISTAFKLIL